MRKQVAEEIATITVHNSTQDPPIVVMAIGDKGDGLVLEVEEAHDLGTALLDAAGEARGLMLGRTP